MGAAPVKCHCRQRGLVGVGHKLHLLQKWLQAWPEPIKQQPSARGESAASLARRPGQKAQGQRAVGQQGNAELSTDLGQPTRGHRLRCQQGELHLQAGDWDAALP